MKLKKTQFVMKLKNSNYDETKIVMKLKNQIVMRLKKTNCDETQKLKGKPCHRRPQIWEKRHYH